MMLKDLVENGGFEPGMKLLPERALAEKLGVGRPAIREAIKALSILDVLESRRGDGTYVKSVDALRAGWPTKVELLNTNFDMLDLLEVRKIIEPQAARLAATRATEVQLLQIEKERMLIENNGKSWKELGRYDLLLHSSIIEAAGNPILAELSKVLAPLLRKSREITAARAPDRVRLSKDHQAIVEAIIKGEAETAERAMLEHLHNVGLDLISDRKR
jgi:GntR family transcriptional regulator, transcriptional repressor for pyruvate dehydrogenase complex